MRKPRKPIELIKAKRIHFNITEMEYLIIKNKAKQLNLSVSEFIRKSINNAIRN